MTTLILLDAEGAALERYPLGPGRTVVGGPGADLVLPGVTTGEFHLWGAEGRVESPPGSAPLTVDGRVGDRHTLADGARIEWAGAVLRFTREAELDELDAPRDSARAWRRLKAGLAVELGRADKQAARRWQEAVVGGTWDPDRAADEILAATPLGDDEPALLERAARLERDLVMQPTLRGVRGAARGVRRAGRNVIASLVAQLIVLGLFALLFAAGLLVARYRGVEIDPLLDAVLAPVLPDAAPDRAAPGPGAGG